MAGGRAVTLHVGIEGQVSICFASLSYTVGSI